MTSSLQSKRFGGALAREPLYFATLRLPSSCIFFVGRPHGGFCVFVLNHRLGDVVRLALMELCPDVLLGV